MKVVLINPYELGRQPFGLAEAAAWLQDAGCEVSCIDLSLQQLAADTLGEAALVGIYVGMHTATRIAMEAIPRIRAIAPHAHLCVYGLYAPVNESRLRELGVGTVLGGEFEPSLAALVRRLRDDPRRPQSEPVVRLDKIDFLIPDRRGLPPLRRYAHLTMPDGMRKVVGFAEASRGCKHLCRHCPVVPVYEGRFRVVPIEVVMADIRQQVAMGAEHISFGDPDFLNGPTHALQLLRRMHAEFPALSYDATIKIQHLLQHADLLPVLKESGCLFITSAVESVDDRILDSLNKNHNAADFTRAVELLRHHGIALSPTFVPFTPWTTLEGYIALLRRLAELALVDNIAPVQLSIRLLVPQGSHLLKLPGFRELLGDFDAKMLGYSWAHSDPRVDALQQRVQAFVADAEAAGRTRHAIFRDIWRMAHTALGRHPPAPPMPADIGGPIPCLSEPWYCCAEPTQTQLMNF